MTDLRHAPWCERKANGQGSDTLQQGKEEAKGSQASGVACDIQFSQYGDQQFDEQQEEKGLTGFIAGGVSNRLPPGLSVCSFV
jgi:hypothetical protein